MPRDLRRDNEQEDEDQEDPRNPPQSHEERPGDRSSKGDRDDDQQDPPRRPGRSRWMDEEDERSRKTVFPVWAMILIGVVGTMLVSGLVAGGVVVYWVSAKVPPGGMTTVGGGPAPLSATYTREDFRAAVIGKTEAEVMTAVGPPARTEPNGGAPWWTYERITRDSATDTVDASAVVKFENGRVVGVGF